MRIVIPELPYVKTTIRYAMKHGITSSGVRTLNGSLLPLYKDREQYIRFVQNALSDDATAVLTSAILSIYVP